MGVLCEEKFFSINSDGGESSHDSADKDTIINKERKHFIKIKDYSS